MNVSSPLLSTMFSQNLRLKKEDFDHLVLDGTSFAVILRQEYQEFVKEGSAKKLSLIFGLLSFLWHKKLMVLTIITIFGNLTGGR